MNRRERLIGWINLTLAALGYCQLLVNVVGYRALPANFVDEYGTFMRGRFAAMSIMSAILLALLATAGFLLLRRVRRAPGFTAAVFITEILAFAIFCARWTFGLSFLSPSVIATGLMNGAIALQIVTLYPIVGLILLNLHTRNRREGVAHA
jgi:hypothetical protein